MTYRRSKMSIISKVVSLMSMFACGFVTLGSIYCFVDGDIGMGLILLAFTFINLGNSIIQMILSEAD